MTDQTAAATRTPTTRISMHPRRGARQWTSRILTVVLLLGLVAPTLEAQPRHKAGKWTLLGQKSVSDRVETDTVRVTARRGDFKAIKLQVRQRGVEFRDVEIHFANGTTQEVELRRVIPAGDESRVIDVVGHDRVIEKIVLRYDAQSLGGKPAKVRILGRR
ncbi:MAG: DUF2541 family protein [Acidobacteria bacterium]|nr:MAG: DUF2541 family protein [Acidobacteriota bacterium]REK04281.1 MAG: DUF2541 family protein [Acidobacteriota bacterium]